MSNTQMNKSYSQRAYIHVEVGGWWEWERKGKIVGGYSKEMLETRERKELRNLQGVLTLNSALICHLLISRGKCEGEV